MNIQAYFKEIEDKVKVCYSIAQEARSKDLDPKSVVEVPIARSLAERVVGLISVVYPQVSEPRIVKRIQELEKEYGMLDHTVALIIAEEIAKEKFCKFKSHEEAIDAGIRVGFAYITVGVVASPLEGYTHFTLKKTKKGEDYFCLYYSGPVRSAGGTGASFSVLIADHLREVFGYAKYDPTEQEIKRTITEIFDYHERITNLQYVPSEKEVEFLARNLPVQINGLASEEKEVSNYKDLERIETNLMRNGVALVLAEGIAQKAHKLLKILKNVRKKGIKLSDWSWLEEFVELKNKEQEKLKKEVSSATYISDIVAGRPVLGHPSQPGGFRLRYGKCRTAGLSSMAMHPLTMEMLKNYIAIGTQLKYEGPGKSSAMSLCDDIEGPIIKLNNGSVIKINSLEKAKKFKQELKEVLFLGDFLVNYAEFFNRGKHLQKPGYCEDWYSAELEKIAKEKIESIDEESKFLVDKIIVDWRTKVSVGEAVKLSERLGIALYPKYIFYWDQISKEEFFALLDWIFHSQIRENKLVLPFNKTEQERFSKGKRALELIGAEHEVAIENVVLNEEETKALFLNLGLSGENLEKEIEEQAKKIKAENVLEIVNQLSKYKIKDKSGTWVGARMGRPEKAKLRKLTGSPHVLFPVGEEGGRMRSVQEALEVGSVKADFPIYYCGNCKQETIYSICEICNNKTEKLHYCPECQQKFTREKCPQHNLSQGFNSRRIDIKHYFDAAVKQLGFEKSQIPVLIKGVRGTSSSDHTPEHLAKGILRAKHKLNVNKDGTIRYDVTEMPLTHFKPKEISASVEKLKEMGYKKDIYGKELENEEQLLEIMPQDVVLPCCAESKEEKADEVFIGIANYLDELLVRLYKQKPFYQIKKREELIGHLVLGLAPHTSAGIVGRIIGFSKIQATVSHPMWHAAMRRDCLGYDTYVPVKKNGKWQIEKIGELVEELHPEEKADNFGTLKKKVSNLKAYSNPGQKKIIEVTKHQPNKMFKIHLEDGRKIELTENHRVYIKNKTEKKANELEVGDKLMISYKKDIEEKDIKEIFLPEIFKDRDDIMLRNVRSYLNKFENLRKYKNFYYRDSFPIKLIRKVLEKHNKTLGDLPSETKITIKRNKICIPIRILLDERLLEIIGLYLSEGFLRKRESKKGFYDISIAGNEEIRNLIKKVFVTHFDLKPSEDHIDHVTFSSRIIYELFFDYLKIGERAKSKRIPSLFLNLKKEKLAALLRGYFEGDGSVSLSDIRITCDTVSEGLKYDLSFVLSRFGIFTKFYDYEKEPGPQVREFYLRKNRKIPKFKITKIIIPSNFVKKFKKIGFVSKRKNNILNVICEKIPRGMKIDFDEDYIYPKVTQIEDLGKKVSYCLNVLFEHNFFANDILVHNCEGDETCIILLLDVFLNFSRAYLPSHRGSTQDAPLVATSILVPTEIDDMAFDIDVLWKYPLELYEAAEQEIEPWKIKILQLKDRLGTDEAYFNFGFTNNVDDFNNAVRCSAYKSIPTMKEKVEGQMWIAEKLRSVKTEDVARLVIDKHFIRDIKGNLRKFSQQEFRCVKCNAKFRRPPLVGKCTKCGGRIIFTVSEGGIIKYLEPALSLATNYNVPAYVKQNLELTKSYIESIFGKETEKQEALKKWF